MDMANEMLDRYGLRKTGVRYELLNAFLDSKSPLSIFDFKSNPRFKNIDESSIYRNLSRFESLNIIQSVRTANDYLSYELVQLGKHHHHIVCSRCEKIQCLSACAIEKELKAMTKKVGFTLETHNLELRGVCDDCQGAVS